MNQKKPEFASKLGYIFDLYADKCIKEHAQSTLNNDFRVLRSLDTYLTEIGFDGNEISIDVLSDWVDGLLEDYFVNTVAMYEKICAKVLRFAGAFGISSNMPDIIYSPDNYVPYIFNEQQKRNICIAADDLDYMAREYPWARAEVPMLTRIYMSCGTRQTEVLVLQMKDVNLEQGILILRKTKMNVERQVPVAESLRSMLESYCQAMGILGKPDAYLFPGKNRDEPLPRYTYRQAFIKILEKAGIPIVREKKRQRSICPYCLRHTFACDSLRHLKDIGVDVNTLYPYLSVYMGHKDLYSTESYLKFTDSMVEEAIEPFEAQQAEVFSGLRLFQDDSEWF